MKRQSLLIACLIILSNIPIFAQQSNSAAAPISGTWTGDFGTSETSRNPIRMELKFDGKDTVSGTAGPSAEEINFAETKKGTFDPKTGALKLEIQPKGEGAGGPLTFEGTVEKNTASGRVSGNNRTGTFKITRK